VVATYGRGLYVTDITPLQEMNQKVLAEDMYLFAIEPKAQRITREFGAEDYLFGDRHLLTPNAPNGIVINYYLKTAMKEKTRVRVTDPAGTEWAVIEGGAEAGINRVVWDMRRQVPGQGGAARTPRSADPFARWAPPGEYVVSVDISAKKFTQKARITKRTGWSIGSFPEVIR